MYTAARSHKAQPKYAGEHAQANNHFGARSHITWAIMYEPEMLGAFYAEKRLEPMISFLDSLSDVQMRDTLFCGRMETVGGITASDPEKAWVLLEETPHWARSHPLFILRQGGLYGQEGDCERALSAYLEVCELWPQDVVGFANACDVLT